MVDVVCEDENLRKKIIFTNNKNTKNAKVYNKVVRHLSARCKERGETCDFTVAQIVGAVNAKHHQNCAFIEESMKLGELIDFDALKTIR